MSGATESSERQFRLAVRRGSVDAVLSEAVDTTGVATRNPAGRMTAAANRFLGPGFIVDMRE